MTILSKSTERLSTVSTIHTFGRVASIAGIALRATGLEGIARIGQYCMIHGSERSVLGEVVATDDTGVTLLPFGDWEGIAAKDRAEYLGAQSRIYPDDSWIGSVINSFGNPLSTSKRFVKGPTAYAAKRSPPAALSRRRVGEKLSTQIRGIDVLTPICRGQRIGIFAGSGVGKTTLLSMLARNINADVIVIALVGERGREVQDFIQRDLGSEGLKKSVIVVSTSDEPPLQRRQAALTATSVAEYFRATGRHVLLLFDSVTRFAMAQREIGLARGEPPTTKGYPPSVFSELSQLLERSGPGCESEGDITAIYTVLVEGDDINEPVADAVRGTLDGHIVLSRAIAEQNRYPAVDFTRSISRMLPDCHSPEELAITQALRKLLTRYGDMEDLIRMGAYREGSDPEVDISVKVFSNAEKFLTQSRTQCSPPQQSFAEFYRILIDAGVELDFGQEKEARP